jgi:cell division septation protein DedD
MPSPELYKDKIEVSLDGRQIFYLFFGGAAIVGLVFVLGVMVGRRVEARGHLDRAETQTASDPLAALDRLERSDNLSFHGTLTGSEPATDVEKAIGELDKRRAAGKPEKKPEAKPETKPEAKPEAKADKVEVKADKPEAKADKPEAKADKPEADKPKAEKRDGDKRDGDKKPKKHDDKAEKLDKSDKPVTRPDAHADAKPDGDARTGEAKTKFTLQLSSFQDKAEAEAFLSSMKSAGFQPYLTEADVSGKGTFYRVRLGSYRSADAANDAKAEFEKSSRKTAQVMRL